MFFSEEFFQFSIFSCKKGSRRSKRRKKIGESCKREKVRRGGGK
jgi:hypothetical protein